MFTTSKEIPTELIEAYWEDLQGFEFDRVVAGMRFIRQNKKGGFRPTSGDIIEAMPSRVEAPALPDPDDGPGVTYADYISRGGRPFANKATHDMLMARPAERLREKEEEQKRWKRRGHKTEPTAFGEILKDALKR